MKRASPKERQLTKNPNGVVFSKVKAKSQLGSKRKMNWVFQFLIAKDGSRQGIDEVGHEIGGGDYLRDFPSWVVGIDNLDS